MEPLIIEETKETPKIKFDGEKGIFSISGKSYPENVHSFYKPVFDYINLYKLNPADKTTVEFEWIYYNSSTSKIIVKIIVFLQEASKDFEVRWICEDDSDVMIDKGLEIKRIFDVNLNIVTNE